MLTTTKFWLWLSTQVSLNAAWCALEQFGTPEQIYFAEENQLRGCAHLKPEDVQALCDKSITKAEQILEDCQRLQVRIVTHQDASYPERLRSIQLPPLVLYVRGRQIHVDDTPIIAMAGTRRATPYGLSMARRFAYELTLGGALVLTGVAPGCDVHAVMGAFDARGTVAVVVPGGVDVPFSNDSAGRRLYEDVARYGTLISEYPPGTTNVGKHFHKRNRLLTGLSVGVLCVEAGERSGTLQVAAYAREQDRDVFVIPARLTDKSSAGTMDLLCQGYAYAVKNGANLLEYYTSLYPQLLRTREEAQPKVALRKMPPAAAKADPKPEPEAQTPQSVAKKRVDSDKPEDYSDLNSLQENLSPTERKILTALGSATLSGEEIIAATELNASELMSTITLMLLKNLVVSEDGGRFRRSAP